MINARVMRDSRSTVVTLEGIFDEKSDLAAVIGPVQGSLRISCGGIQRFNSIGVKNWIHYFEELSRNGVQLSFADCSPAAVEQGNIYRNFFAEGEVLSVRIPYFCTLCKTHFDLSRDVRHLRAIQFGVPNEPCPKCRKPAEFDDLPEAYFAFLQE